IRRNEENGGSLLLRPAGQEIIANAYTRFKSQKTFINRIKTIDFSLDGKTWKFIFWNGKILSKEVTLKKNLLLYLLGKYSNEAAIHQEISRVYKLNNQIYKNHIKPPL